MIKTIKKFYFNLINSINGLKLSLKQHSFIAEIVGGFILIPYLKETGDFKRVRHTGNDLINNRYFE